MAFAMIVLVLVNALLVYRLNKQDKEMRRRAEKLANKNPEELLHEFIVSAEFPTQTKRRTK